MERDLQIYYFSFEPSLRKDPQAIFFGHYILKKKCFDRFPSNKYGFAREILAFLKTDIGLIPTFQPEPSSMSLFVYASSECAGETAQLYRLVRAFTTRICIKYENPTSSLILTFEDYMK